jgi:asparagine synthase (glutamine-hydrolysing)
MAMGNSVEIRLPFLDPNVMEFMGRVPAIWKILGLKEKYLLKKSFRGTLPDSIALRPKYPYRAPAPLLNEKLLQAARRETGLFDPIRVNRLIKKAAATPALSETDNMALTGIITAQLLHEQYIENFTPRGPSALAPALVIDRRTTEKGIPS